MASIHPPNQYYVREFLLRNFSVGEQGAVHVFDKLKGTTFTAFTCDIAGEFGPYDEVRPNRWRSASLRDSQMEADVSHVITGIVRRQSLAHLTVEERMVISLFTAAQQLYTMLMQRGLKQVVDMVRRAAAARGVRARLLDCEVNEDDPDCWHGFFVSTARLFAKDFFDKPWILEQTPPGAAFYSSDTPLVVYNDTHESVRKRPGFDSGLELYLPISRQLTIRFLSGQLQQLVNQALEVAARTEATSDRCSVEVGPLRRQAGAVTSGNAQPLAAETVVVRNALQVVCSSRFVYSSDGDFRLAKSIIAGNPQFRGSRRVL